MTTKQSRLLSLRTVIGTSLIILGVFASVTICLVSLSAPCVNNYYNQLPVYPDATLTDEQSSRFNYIGFGDLQFTYTTTDDLSTVEAWYFDAVDDVRNEARRASVTGDDVPVTWNHTYVVSEMDNDSGTEIILRAECLN